VCYNKGMAGKHSPLLRTQVEIAAACGVSERMIGATLHVGRSTVRRWTIMGAEEYKKRKNREWVQANSESVRQKAAEYRSTPAIREANRVRSRAWYQANKGRKTEAALIRRGRLQKWPCSTIEKMMIEYRYQDARRLTEETGVVHHVDHIIPIKRGGPHLPWNLRVIPWYENLKKGAKIQ
jgi:5-methylcytosine-specific restriction endonuclease McrA